MAGVALIAMSGLALAEDLRTGRRGAGADAAPEGPVVEVLVEERAPRSADPLVRRLEREHGADSQVRTVAEEDISFAPPKSLRSLTVVA